MMHVWKFCMIHILLCFHITLHKTFINQIMPSSFSLEEFPQMLYLQNVQPTS